MAAQDTSTDAGSLQRWQNRLLPLMVLMTLGLTAFFLVASILQLRDLNEAIQDSPAVDLAGLLAAPRSSGDPVDAREDLRLRGLLMLEANIIERRHHDASVALMARVWTRYMGFITGMTLAMVGAAFVLGRLSGGTSTLAGGVGNATLNLRSASPGLFMTLLGSILMIVTITNHPRITVDDVPTFVQPIPGFALPPAVGPVESGAPPLPQNWPAKE